MSTEITPFDAGPILELGADDFNVYRTAQDALAPAITWPQNRFFDGEARELSFRREGAGGVFTVDPEAGPADAAILDGVRAVVEPRIDAAPDETELQIGWPQQLPTKQELQALLEPSSGKAMIAHLASLLPPSGTLIGGDDDNLGWWGKFKHFVGRG